MGRFNLYDCLGIRVIFIDSSFGNNYCFARMDYKDLSDEVLLKLLAASDELAYKTIYERYWRVLFLKAYAKIYSRESAEEMIQEIFASLWQNRKERVIQHLESYLVTAVKYNVIGYIRARVRRQEKFKLLAGSEADNSTHETIALYELARNMHDAIASLPDKTRQVFTLSRIEKIQVREIAQRLDLSEKAVEYHITRALKLMRIHLKDFIFPATIGIWLGTENIF